VGDWGWGIGDWGLGPIPNPQSPIPNPQSPLLRYKYKKNYKIVIILINNYNIKFLIIFKIILKFNNYF